MRRVHGLTRPHAPTAPAAAEAPGGLILRGQEIFDHYVGSNFTIDGAPARARAWGSACCCSPQCEPQCEAHAR